jgi:hypothetical protein
MARRSKKKKKTSLMDRARASFEEISWPAPRRMLVAAAWLLGCVAIVGGWIQGVPALRAAVAADARAERVTVEFLDRPAWVRGDLLELLEATAIRQLTGDPFDRENLAVTRDALMSTGWFESIEQVRRVSASHVEVRATYVTPAAVVRDGEGDHLVTAAGRLLPRSYPHDGASEQLVITGVHFERPQRPGAAWDGLDIRAALRLVDRLSGVAWRAQIESIDAGAFLDEQRLTIVTDLGARIAWGSAPDDEMALEIDADRKIAYLDRAYEDFGRIDTGYAGTLRFYDRGYFAE